MVIVAALLVSATSAFAPNAFVSNALVSQPGSLLRHHGTRSLSKGCSPLFVGPEARDEVVETSRSSPQQVQKPSGTMTFAAVTTAALIALTSSPLAALAAPSPDWGIFEGKTGSLLHPIMMGSLLLYSAYTAYLGFQWRRQRTMGDEIKSLQASLPPPPAEGESPSPQATALSSQIAELQAERKSLAAAGPRDKHFSQGALLVFLGTAFAIEVCC